MSPPGRAQRFVRRTLALSRKEVAHILRDLRSLYLALGMPIVMLLLMGFGVSFDLSKVPIAVVDFDHTADSRALVRAFTASDELRVAAEPPDVASAQALFRSSDVVAVLVIPADFSVGLDRGERQSLQLLVDGVDGNVANQVLSKADALAMAANGSLVAERMAARGPARPGGGVGATVWTRFNPGGRSALYIVPGLAAFVLALAAVLLTSLTVAREWEKGSMEQLFATPVGRLEIVLGKLLPYLVVGWIQFLTVVVAGAWVFGLPLQGNVLVLALCATIFLTAMLGQGLLISVVTRNQMVATQLATMSVMLPSMLLSGFLFPVQNMPIPIQVLANILPAKHFVSILRGIMLKGAGLGELWVDVLALSAFTFFMVAVSTRRFQRRLA